MRGRETQTLDAGHFREVLEQQRQIRCFAIAHLAAIGVYVLTQQGNLLCSLVCEPGNFRKDIVKRPGYFFAPGIGHHAEAAIFAAAFHDGDKRSAALVCCRRQRIELLYFRKRNVNLRTAAAPACLDKLRQSMQRLRAEYDIHERRALDNRLSLLARNTTANTDDKVLPELLQRAQPPEGVKYAFLRVFAHRAGIEQDNVRLGWIVCSFESVGLI